MNYQEAYKGTQTPQSGATEFNAQQYQIRQLLAMVNVGTLVEVVSVTNSGGLSPVGFVDVQPLVNQLDGYGNPVPHGILHNLPYLRIQGGANAVIIDPQKGDIGIAVFADRDISKVKASKSQNNPGSYRRFDMADGMYFGGSLNGTPSQYVQFNSTGINIVSPFDVSIQAPTVNVSATTASVTANTSATVTSPSIILKNAGTALKNLLNSLFATWALNHVHSNGNGGADTGIPTTTPSTGYETSVVQAE